VRIAAQGGLAAVVRSTEYFGADTVVTVEAGGDAIAARLPGRHEFPEGDAVGVVWSEDDAHLFDAATGKRRDDIRFTADKPERRTA
jgi:sn-glycerol 3-phosphate transport system ATP-binding protein